MIRVIHHFDDESQGISSGCNNQFEQSFSKLKSLLRKTQARTLKALWSAVGSLLEQFSKSECERYIHHCGYY